MILEYFPSCREIRTTSGEVKGSLLQFEHVNTALIRAGFKADGLPDVWKVDEGTRERTEQMNNLY